MIWWGVALSLVGHFLVLGWVSGRRTASESRSPVLVSAAEGIGREVAPIRRPARGEATRAGEPAPAARPAVLTMDAVLAGGNAGPIYPEKALERGWEGRVVLRLKMNGVGRVTDVSIVDSSGYDVLDASAVSAARGWVVRGYEAASIPIEFRID